MAESKCSKRLKATECSIDRISNLPDPLISRILSLLPTKCAVATSVLSTRWKYLWTSITNLHFDFGFAEIDPETFDPETFATRRNKFTNFVSRVLLLLNPPSIQNFHLTCKYGCSDPSCLNSWICVAFGRTVRELELSLSLNEPMKLPLSHFSCNVVVLKLKHDIHFNIPPSASICFPSLQTLHLYNTTLAIASNSLVSFPNLKSLHLDCVEYLNEDSVHKLLSSCPVLDDLVIMRGFPDNLSGLTICIPSLTRLTLRFWSFENQHPLKLQLDTPALQYLDLKDEMPCEYLPVENLYSMLQAKVSVDFDDEDVVDVLNRTSIAKFIGSLSKVKFLSVLGLGLEAIRIASANIPCFHNLTWLELEVPVCLAFSVVINNLLESMDNLQHLVIWERLRGGGNCSHQSWWTEPHNVPKCLLSGVTSISFTMVSFTKMIDDCCDQLELLRYFLKNGKVLQLLTITISGGNDCVQKQHELLKKVSMFARGSQTCQVAFKTYLPPFS